MLIITCSSCGEAVRKAHRGLVLEATARTCLELNSNPADHSALGEQARGLEVRSRNLFGYNLTN